VVVSLVGIMNFGSWDVFFEFCWFTVVILLDYDEVRFHFLGLSGFQPVSEYIVYSCSSHQLQ